MKVHIMIRGALRMLVVVAAIVLLAACSGSSGETTDAVEEAVTQIQGTMEPGPLVPEPTSGNTGGEGGSGNNSNSGGAGSANSGDAAGEKFGLPSSDECQSMAEELENGLGVPDTNVTVEEDSVFSDASTGLTSPACQIAISANGTEVAAGAAFEDFANAVKQLFIGMGFEPDESAAVVENPNGKAYILRRGEELVSVEIDAQPVEFNDCPEGQPISECNLPADKISYSVRVYYSRLEVEQ